ncbi:MAG: threonylcarbamoyl-AMP synthase [Flavobacteriaceae bacterium]|nr:threonylcarbamoyl-AMP synthase [Flavobacteriaceae bacterium]
MEKELKIALSHLDKGGVILYPTDTVWGLGCDATKEHAVDKIYEIKRRKASKSLIILVDSFEMLQEYVSIIPEEVKRVLSNTIKPTTIIYRNPIGLASNVVAIDTSIAIRIVQDEFCQSLIKKFGKPIVSTSANISGEGTPRSFKEIDPSILDAVDYVVNLRHDEVTKGSSRLIKILDDGTTETLRD